MTEVAALCAVVVTHCHWHALGRIVSSSPSHNNYFPLPHYGNSVHGALAVMYAALLLSAELLDTGICSRKAGVALSLNADYPSLSFLGQSGYPAEELQHANTNQHSQIQPGRRQVMDRLHLDSSSTGEQAHPRVSYPHPYDHGREEAAPTTNHVQGSMADRFRVTTASTDPAGSVTADAGQGDGSMTGESYDQPRFAGQPGYHPEVSFFGLDDPDDPDGTSESNTAGQASPPTRRNVGGGGTGADTDERQTTPQPREDGVNAGISTPADSPSSTSTTRIPTAQAPVRPVSTTRAKSLRYELTVKAPTGTRLITGTQADIICEVELQESMGLLGFQWTHHQTGEEPGVHGDVRPIEEHHIHDPTPVTRPPNNTLVFLQSKIQIVNVQRHNAGHYICQMHMVENHTAIVVGERSIDLHVEDHWLRQPVFWRKLKNTTVLEGSRINLVCDVLGGLLLKTRMRFPSGDRIRKEHGLTQAVFVGIHGGVFRAIHRLTYSIQDVSQRRDAGVYTCQASNKHPAAPGRVFSSALLTVEERIIPNLVLAHNAAMEERSVLLGTNTSLLCKSYYTRWQPRVNISWLRDGKYLPSNMHVLLSRQRHHAFDGTGQYSYTELRSELSIEQFSGTDAGSYTCMVSSAQGSMQETVKIRAKTVPSIQFEQTRDVRLSAENEPLFNLTFTAGPSVSIIGVFVNGSQLACQQPADNCIFSAENLSDPANHIHISFQLKRVRVNSSGKYELQISTSLGLIRYIVFIRIFT
ncbi:uncharacterized protein LOC135823300 [Sycon ciliatum]|uniref:uncharacterized protein LOC135823300 n=1 Tax=Sycon ciliatum TaxID=27933 RepID=UPI0031F64783